MISGLECLTGVPEEEILILGLDLDTADSAQELFERFPRAQRRSLRPGTSPFLEATRLAAVNCEVLVLAQDYRKLKALAFFVRASERFVLSANRLHPLDRSEAVLGTVPGLSGGIHRLRSRLEPSIIPPPHTLGNDYSEIETSVRNSSGNWPRLTVSVMVPVYNRREVLAKTLAGLSQQTYPRELFEVIVADDGSSDHPEEVLAEFTELRARVVRQEDLGYRLAEVRNLAIEASQAEVIVSLDCDMIPVPGFLESHLRWFHGHSASVCTIGYRKFIDGGELSAAQIKADFGVVERAKAVLPATAIRDPQDPARDWRVRFFESTKMLKEHAAPYLFASGGNVAFRREDAIVAGRYHAGFQRWGGEDADFAYRLERRGAYLIPEPGALAYHQDHPEAAVREEDRKTTKQILGRRVPRLRQYVTDADAGFELPRVSVLIECHGGTADGLATTLRDVAAQRDQDFEVVLFGDEHELSGRPANVRTIRVTGETGGERWRRAVDAVHGEYVLALRSGDRIGPRFVERLARALARDNSVSVSYWAPVVRGPCSRYSRARHLAGLCEPWPMMFRHRDYCRVGGYDAGLDVELQFDLGLRLAERGFVSCVRDVAAALPLRTIAAGPERRRVIERALRRQHLDWVLEGNRLRSSRWTEDLLLRLSQRGSEKAEPQS